MKTFIYMQIVLTPSDRREMATLPKKTDSHKYLAKKRAKEGDCFIGIKNHYYTAVAEIRADDMEDALGIIPNPHNIGKTIKQLSMMEGVAFGDIIIDESGDWYLIQPNGLRRVKKVNFGNISSLSLMP